MVMMCHLQSAQVRSFHQYTTYRGHTGAVVFSIFAWPNSLGLINEANETRSVQCRQPDKHNYWTQRRAHVSKTISAPRARARKRTKLPRTPFKRYTGCF